jgi:biotin synthase-related radical SAM superfamily protein
MTLTSGTEESTDKGAKRYIEILKGLKASHPDIPLHVQIEPLKDISFIDRLKKAGADTIGIHIEILDEQLRREITPGKAHIPYSLFKQNWNHSLNIFGENQVESFVLMGFNIPKKQILKKLEEMISIGVIPFITPVRAIPLKNSKTPSTDHNLLLDIYKEASKLMHKYNVNPLKNVAGCVRCGGCSAINEAYRMY